MESKTKVELKINADTPAELRRFIVGIADQFGVVNAAPVADAAEIEPPKQEAPKEEKPKKTKAKTKTKKEEPKPEPVAETPKEEAPAKEAKEYTKKDITDACQKVATVKNLDTAKEILQKFGAVRISEVKAEDYAAFIAECEKAVK